MNNNFSNEPELEKLLVEIAMQKAVAMHERTKYGMGEEYYSDYFYEKIDNLDIQFATHRHLLRIILLAPYNQEKKALNSFLRRVNYEISVTAQINEVRNGRVVLLDSITDYQKPYYCKLDIDKSGFRVRKPIFSSKNNYIFKIKLPKEVEFFDIEEELTKEELYIFNSRYNNPVIRIINKTGLGFIISGSLIRLDKQK